MSITLSEARANVRARVTYSNGHDEPELGVITSVNGSMVFVLYLGSMHPTATDPGDLTFTPSVSPARHMTGPGHYQAAELLLEMASDDELDGVAERYHVAAAQAHATLALAAATALRDPDGGTLGDNHAAWHDAAGVKHEGTPS